MSNCFSCKKISDRSWRRKTNEVDITVVISEDGKKGAITCQQMKGRSSLIWSTGNSSFYLS